MVWISLFVSCRFYFFLWHWKIMFWMCFFPSILFSWQRSVNLKLLLTVETEFNFCNENLGHGGRQLKMSDPHPWQVVFFQIPAKNPLIIFIPDLFFMTCYLNILKKSYHTFDPSTLAFFSPLPFFFFILGLTFQCYRGMVQPVSLAKPPSASVTVSHPLPPQLIPLSSPDRVIFFR